ncbi:MAG: acyl-CoA dehydrogenase, partial [Chloroflexi bacterium]
PTEGIALDIPTRQALSRIYARQAAFKVGMEGMEWLIGAGQTNMNLGREVNSVAIFAAQMGNIADMDFAAAQLTKAFPVN